MTVFLVNAIDKKAASLDGRRPPSGKTIRVDLERSWITGSSEGRKIGGAGRRLRAEPPVAQREEEVLFRRHAARNDGGGRRLAGYGSPVLLRAVVRDAARAYLSPERGGNGFDGTAHQRNTHSTESRKV